MLRIVLNLVLFAFSLLFIPSYANGDISLTVNIISHSLQNGAGKQVDVSVLKRELEKLGHQVHLFDYYKVNKITPADINLFLAQFKSDWFSQAKLNWFIPNAECCDATPEDLWKFDLVLCKTEESLRIFRPFSREVYYLGFTSLDRARPFVAKNFSKHLHIAGKSRMKGTEQVLKAWKTHSELPHLILIKHKRRTHSLTIPPKNVKLVNKRISNRSLLNLQNQCGVHLCPSKTEGFGHYIMEAMSAEAVVITTDAPPMNEFIKDPRCLVKYKSSGQWKYATTYVINEKELAYKVKALQQLSHEELQAIGRQNREEYLRRKAEFAQNFERLINRAVDDLYGSN